MTVLEQTIETSSFAVPAEALKITSDRIDAHIKTIQNHPDKRDGAFPYYLFHPPGKKIHGTVMLFHGFSARPHQMWRLADYLFTNGFNVYQCTIAGHSYVNPEDNWPQVDLKSDIREPLSTKVKKDPVLSRFFQNLKNPDSQTAATPSPLQMLSLVRRLRRLDSKVVDMILAVERSNDPDFDRYYDSNHMDYLKDAEERLAELEAMPGPIYTLGLSVGGAVALALAAANPARIKKVVAYAPLLEVWGETRERYVNIAGPLDIKEFGWDDLRFPLGCFTASNRFGAFVRQRQNEKVLEKTPTLMILTENEDAADIKTNQKFSKSLGRERNGHFLYTYPADDLVPHPMVDPLEVSQNMSNAFWQTMYQETFRFLALDSFNSDQMESTNQDLNLPIVSDIA
ncbi:hypothetical protein Lepto7376_3418 [[Leptolyngbya] sp. PCC 7376]|uniref:hypothetical protein n=1 Tax=[Leptolyngbya] sp. PCC 7376 TaxID=111781 RepID=UPI00029F3DFD|nr:hypothetical protein [[Leptolyngbya] sp. PCC 7376]AFY39623.1 hypothetical protein Lepto7376_3418 [[Leptolyngbya] sp. PCC 7376]